MKPGILLINLIKKMPTIHAKYKYTSEKNINPTYCDIEHSEPLCRDEKKIWVLRGDLILAVGNKNAYVSKGNASLKEVVIDSADQYIDYSDRYGHPSLAMPENDFDGSVYYAGWLYQHANHIEVFLCSGRYQNNKISALQREYIERYISIQFINAYGTQDIVFFDWGREEDFYCFLKGTSFPPEKLKRTYSLTSIKNKSLLDLAIDYVDDLVTAQLFEAGAKISPMVNGQHHVIHVLSKKGLLQHVKTLITSTPQLVNVKDSHNNTPLVWAASGGHTEVVDFLLAHGADIHLGTQLPSGLPSDFKHHAINNYSPLDWAINNGHVDTILTLINAGAKANHVHTKIKNKSLKEIIEEGDLSLVKFFIEHNKRFLNQLDEKGYTPLHYSARYGQIEIARYLVAENADLDIPTTKTSDNLTALELATKHKHDSIAILLFEAGAKIPKAVNGRNHIIHILARNGMLNYIQTLIESFPDLIHIKDSKNQTPLFLAANQGHDEVVEFLTSKDADLHLAIKMSQYTLSTNHITVGGALFSQSLFVPVKPHKNDNKPRFKGSPTRIPPQLPYK